MQSFVSRKSHSAPPAPLPTHQTTPQTAGLFATGTLGFVQLVEAQQRKEQEARQRQHAELGFGEWPPGGGLGEGSAAAGSGG